SPLLHSTCALSLDDALPICSQILTSCGLTTLTMVRLISAARATTTEPAAGAATSSSTTSARKRERDMCVLPQERSNSSFAARSRSEEHTSELQSPDHLVCRL